MKREYKFRGLRKDGKGFAFGFVVVEEDGTTWIVNGMDDTHTWDEVIPETVGQLTPFEDINKNKVFIGDLIQDGIVGMVSEIVFTDYGNIGLRSINNSVKKLEYETIDPSWVCTTVEIIGNIHENSELLSQ